MRDILQLSLNTGATYLLQQMGGGTINEKGRTAWYDYMNGRYKFGQKTGIEGYEETGVIPDPKTGDGLNIRFANSAFGQGMTVTPLQLAAALSSIVNGGTYYKPSLVDKYIDASGEEQDVTPKILRPNVVSEQVSAVVRDYMKYVVDKNNLPAKREGYAVGGKTGTAQIAKPGGGYYEDRYNGMYIGFVGGDKPQYVIVVRVNTPGIAGYAGSRAAGPIFADISNMLINGFNISAIR
jgi:cell division protein FtsI/penicillin-binding protein 2